VCELQAYQPGTHRSTIVAVGDPITDGSGTTIDGNDRWEDFLNRRLRQAGSGNVVVNAGIGGNRVIMMRWGPVLTGAYASAAKLSDHSGNANTPDARCDGCGEPAVIRLERDVFSLPNVSAIILFEGVNDIGAGATYGEIIAEIKTSSCAPMHAGSRSSLRRSRPITGLPTTRSIRTWCGSRSMNGSGPPRCSMACSTSTRR